jgi:hypothetical protein
MAPLLTLVATLASARAVAAEEPVPVVVMPVAVEGDVSPEDQALLQQALLDALGKDEGLELRVTPTRCADAGCVAALARTHEAVRIVDPKVAYGTNDYQVTLSVLDETGASVQLVSLSCEICTIADVATRFAQAAEQVRVQLGEASARSAVVVVDSIPPGAVVWVDGKRLGVTPLEAEVGTGPHELRVERPGHVTQKEEFEGVAGGRSAFNLRLAPAEAEGKGPGARRGLFIAGLASIGVGAGAAIGGAVALALDSRPIERKCVGNDVDINGECRYLHDTKLVGAVVLAAGGAALVTGVVLAVVGRKGARKRGAEEQQARRWRLQPHGFGVRGWF